MKTFDPKKLSAALEDRRGQARGGATNEATNKPKDAETPPEAPQPQQPPEKDKTMLPKEPEAPPAPAPPAGNNVPDAPAPAEEPPQAPKPAGPEVSVKASNLKRIKTYNLRGGIMGAYPQFTAHSQDLYTDGQSTVGIITAEDSLILTGVFGRNALSLMSPYTME